MKKHIVLSLSAAAAVMLSACSKDDAGVLSEPQPDYGVRITAVSPLTRTAFTDNGEQGVSVRWNQADAIGVFVKVNGQTTDANIGYSASESAASTGFVPMEKNTVAKWTDETSAHDFYAYYPYSKEQAEPTAIPVSVPAVQQQLSAGSLANLNKIDVLYAAVKGAVMPENKAVDFSFRHPLSILSVTLNSDKGVCVTDQIIVRFQDKDEILAVEGATLDITAENPALSYSEAASVSNEIKVSLRSPLKLTPESEDKVFMLITPGHGGKKFDVLAVVDGEEVLLGTKGIPAAGIPAGVTAMLDFTAPGKEYVEKIIDLSELGTANSYVVSEADVTYKFRADVAGNGVLPAGFDAMGLSTALEPKSARLLKTMVASNFYKNGTADGTDETMSKLVEVSSVQLRTEGGVPYVYFKTPNIFDFAAGNAVICVTDASGEIIWNWHIWVTPDWQLGEGDITLAANAGCENAVIMDRNLGALSNGSDEGYDVMENAQAACGLMYQWGRKDPFTYINVGVNNNAMGNYQKADGEIVRTKNACEIETAAGSGRYEKKLSFLTDEMTPDMASAIKYVTANPETFFTRFGGATEYTASLFEPNSREDRFGLWGNPTKNTYTKFSAKKTAYDPCPVGYRVPDPHVLSFIVRSHTGMNIGKAAMEQGDLNSFNVDYSKSPWDESTKSVNFAQCGGFYAYTGSALNKDQDPSERTNTQTTFIPVFNTLWYSTGEGNGKNEHTSLMTTMFNGNRPGYNIQNNGYMACFGSYDYHTTGCPVRCMSERAKIGDADQINDNNNKINDLNKVEPWK